MQNNSFKYKNSDSNAFTAIVCVVLCLIIAFTAFRVFCAVNYLNVCVVGPSMEGTLHDGDCLFAIKSSSVRRGDIVIIKTGDEPDDDAIIKRVIALGGDTVELKSGVLYLNGEKVDEPYIDPANNTASKRNNTFKLEEPVPEGYMFFLGDNRDDSNDSRSKYGVMPVSSTIGVVADWSLSSKGTVTALGFLFGFKTS